MKRRNRVAVTCLTLVVLASAFLSCSRKDVSAPPAEQKSVRLTSSKNIWCLLPVVAKKRGFFEEQRLDVTIEYVQAAKLAMDALVSGSSDFSTVVDINVAFLGFTGNKDVRIVGTIVKSFDGAIVARRSSGIESPADLKGKRIGVLQGTTSQVFADRFFEKHRLSPTALEVINLQPVAIQTSIATKEIDAGSVWEPFVFNISTALGSDAVAFRDADVYTGYMNIALDSRWAAKNGDAVKRFLIALSAARDFVRSNPEEAQAIIAAEINLDVETVRAIWGQYDFSLSVPGEELLGVIRSEGEWIRKSQAGFAERPSPDYSIFMDSSYLLDIERSVVRER